MGQEVLLQMTDICKEFPGVKALDHVSLTVKKGTVHALMGENGAGKSTLMKCLFGIYSKDAGKIELEGKEVNFKNSREALNNGVAMVHQELNQALKRNVMDNIWLGRYPMTAGIMVNEHKMLEDTNKIFEELGIAVDPKRIKWSICSRSSICFVTEDAVLSIFLTRWQRSCGSQMKSPSCVTVPGSQQSLHRT